MSVDTDWFFEVIAASPYRSLRGVARHMHSRQGKQLAPSALSLALRGRRTVSAEEIQQLSNLLNVPVGELLNHLQS